jgi:hypothetical protein
MDNISEFINTIPEGNGCREEIEVYMRSGKPVVIFLNDDAGNPLYSVMPKEDHENDSYNGLWLNSFETKEEAESWVKEYNLNYVGFIDGIPEWRKQNSNVECE